MTVPIPTNIASHSDRNWCTREKSSEFERSSFCRFGSAILPSADAAQLSIMRGFTKFYWLIIKR